MSRESFGSFDEAIEYYRNDAGIRYPVTVELDECAQGHPSHRRGGARASVGG